MTCRYSLLAGLLFLVISSSDVRATTNLPYPPYPEVALKQGDQGTVIIRVKFDADGKVETCEIIKSTATPLLDAATVTFVKANWAAKDVAGKTQTIPITYSPPSHAPKAPAPVLVPNMLAPGESERRMTLRVSFGSNGRVDHADVLEPSGSDALDKRVIDWIKAHWESEINAGKTVNVPLDLKPPAPEKKP